MTSTASDFHIFCDLWFSSVLWTACRFDSSQPFRERSKSLDDTDSVPSRESWESSRIKQITAPRTVFMGSSLTARWIHNIYTLCIEIRRNAHFPHRTAWMTKTWLRPKLKRRCLKPQVTVIPAFHTSSLSSSSNGHSITLDSRHEVVSGQVSLLRTTFFKSRQAVVDAVCNFAACRVRPLKPYSGKGARTTCNARAQGCARRSARQYRLV